MHRRTAALDDDRSGRVADAVGQRLPFLDGDALAGGLGNEPRHRTHEVYVLDDDARVVDLRAVVEDQHWQLAERIVGVHRIARVPCGHLEHLAFDLFLREHDAHLAGERARPGCDQLEHGRRGGKRVGMRSAV
jgi:hypothetical protein